MGIKQLSGTYIPAEDRILLRVSTDAGEEFRFWMTRPITGKLLAAIHAAAMRTIAEKFPPQVAETVAEFELEAIHAQTRLDDEFLPGATLPLGEPPVLVVKLTAAEQADHVSLDLTLSNGINFNLRLPRRLAQQFGVLLDELQLKGKWGLSQASFTEAAEDIPATSALQGRKIVH